jgi:hypothetical protein
MNCTCFTFICQSIQGQEVGMRHVKLTTLDGMVAGLGAMTARRFLEMASIRSERWKLKMKVLPCSVGHFQFRFLRADKKRPQKIKERFSRWLHQTG